MTVPEDRRRLAIAGSIATIVAIALGVVMLALAMRAYPGGTALDRTTVGHAFWWNFLCDLTGDNAVNGVANPRGSALARGAMAAFAAAFGCFSMIVPLSFANGRAFDGPIRTLGLLAVLGVLLVPATTGRGHIVVVLASAGAGLAASTLALIGSVRWSQSRLLAALACAAVAAGLADAVLYAQSHLVHPRVVPPALPFFQRLALILLVAWMVAVAVRVLMTPARASERDHLVQRR